MRHPVRPSPRRAFPPLPAALATAGVAALAAGTLVATARAESLHMQPGLWEQTMTLKSQSGEMESRMAEMQQRLAAMPPEQRAMVQAQMARSGVQMGARGTTFRVCISKAMAERDPAPPKESRCEHSAMTRTGTSVAYKFSCAGSPGHPPTNGEGTFTMTSSTSYSGVSTMTTESGGKADRMDATAIGKWLGNDCGDVQPAVK